jgi:hypothetical protein
MLDFLNAALERTSVHEVGNKTNGDRLIVSNGVLAITDETLRQLLFKFFTTAFSTPEYYRFTFSNLDFKLNPLYQFATAIFEDCSDENFHINSAHIARQLFEVSIHPQIKAGDLFVAYFSGLSVSGETCDAVGIFKSENRQDFLKVGNDGSSQFSINYEDGINIDKLDKGCLIMKVAPEEGYRICIVDKGNRNNEAQYWKDTFLQVTPVNDEYHFTKDFLDIARNFVSEKIEEEFEVSKADKIDYLNRSVEYFKTHDTFEKEEFEQQVFHDEQLIASFRNFERNYSDENGLEIAPQFGISPQAVKKQERVFKSVLKLDKNFHIYIHGNKELIEQGIDPDGRKFYKIYYESES